MNIVEHFDHIKQWLENYIASFDRSDPFTASNLDLKREHTFRVCEETDIIAAGLELNETDAAIAGFCALLHDVGRFEQFRRYRTFADNVSVDHGDFGCQIIAQHGLLDALEEEHRKLIMDAVGHHNKITISDELPERSRFFTRILRDADKLDIWKVVIDYYESNEKNDAVKLDLSLDNTFTEKVFHDLMDYRMADKKDLRTLNDFKLNQMAWVFDLNFKCSVIRVREKDYLRRIASHMDNVMEVQKIYSRAQAYVYSR